MNERTRVPEVDSGFAKMLGVTVVYARPDRVIGEMKISQHHLTQDGHIHAGAVIGLADELASRGAMLNQPAGKTAVTLETKTNLFKPCRSDMLSGEAISLHVDENYMTWQTSISDADGHLAAVVSKTQLLVSHEPEAGRKSAKVATASQSRPDATAPGKKNGPAGSLAEDRREKIAAAASEVIARKGFANSTIREIADAAGLHVPTLYQYVTSKDEVLELVYNWVMARLHADVDKATEGCFTTRDKLLATVTAIISNSNLHRRHVGVLNRELRSLSPKSRLDVLQKYQVLLGRIGMLISEGIERGEFRQVEPQLTANLIEAMCDVWPLRQFAVAHFGLDTFKAELTAFIDASLVLRKPVDVSAD